MRKVLSKVSCKVFSKVLCKVSFKVLGKVLHNVLVKGWGRVGLRFGAGLGLVGLW